MEDRCRTRNCVRFSNGCQRRVRQITQGLHIFLSKAELISTVAILPKGEEKM